jgi:short-subunit dehydrogenase
MIYPGWVSTGISGRALKADGSPLGQVSAHEKGAMPVEACARIIIRAIEKHKREVIMTLQGKMGVWFRHVVPGVVQQIAAKEMK